MIFVAGLQHLSWTSGLTSFPDPIAGQVALMAVLSAGLLQKPAQILFHIRQPSEVAIRHAQVEGSGWTMACRH
jgi:hypothetical protein